MAALFGAILFGHICGACAQTISSHQYGVVIVCDYDSGDNGRRYWVGCTLISKQGDELDLSPKRVSGKGKVTFVVDSRSFSHASSYAVGLWKTKVENCGCDYCRKNGFHLEGRLDSSGGIIEMGQADNSERKVQFKRVGRDVRVYWGDKQLFDFPSKTTITGPTSKSAQQKTCNAVESLLSLAASLAGLPGTGAMPPICRFTAKNDTGRTVGSVQIDPLSDDGLYYGLRASGIGGQLIADGLLDMGFIQLNDNEYVYYF